MPSGFRTFHSPGPSACSESPWAPRSAASVPAGAFQMPRAPSVRAMTPATVPDAGRFRMRKPSSGSAIGDLWEIDGRIARADTQTGH